MASEGKINSALVCALTAFVIWVITVMIFMCMYDANKNDSYLNKELIPTFKLCSKKNYTIEMVKNKGGNHENFRDK